MSEYQWGVLLALCGLLFVALVNTAYFRRLRADRPPDGTKVLSVLVPARNEETRIGACVESILRQDHPNFELLILDDGSDDATAERAAEAAGVDPRFRLLKGEDLPEGWTGKNFACRQLYEAAGGDILLFTDADTEYHPGALRKIAAALDVYSVDMLSLIPHQRMVGFAERLFMPLLQYVTMCFLPFPLVTLTRYESLSMANGQCMAFRRRAYEAAGGHEAQRSAVVEDVRLARAMKRSGGRLRVMAGEGSVSCRMYEALQEIRRGFSKNIFPGLGYSLQLLASVLLFFAATSVMPYVFLAGGLLFAPAAPWLPVAAAQVGVLLAIRILLAVKFRQPPESGFLHPLAVLLLISIGMDSAREALGGGGSEWKGRRYAPPRRKRAEP